MARPLGTPLESIRSAYRREVLWASILFAFIFLTVLGLGSSIVISDLSNKEVFKMLNGYSKELEESLAKVPTTQTLTGFQQQKIVSTRINEFLTDKKIFESVELYDSQGRLVPIEDRLKAGYLVPGADPKGLKPGEREIETRNRIPISVPVPIEPGKMGTAILSVSEDVLARQATQFRNEMVARIVILMGIISLLLGLAFIYVLRLLRLTRKIEAEAQDQQRLSYLGLLSSGIAHEVKNPLNSIQMNLQLLEEEAASGTTPEKLHTWIEPIQREIRRLERLVNDFLLYARPLTANAQPVRVQPVLESIAGLVAEEARQRGVRIAVEVPEDFPVLSTDESLLRTALMNLVFNAVQALDGGGTVTLRASAEGAVVEFEVADDGPGVPVDRREQVFEIFFTTKAGGTGLGLPIARRIVEALGGTLTLDASEAGACFRATLPWTEAV
jgi:signal transduction histidine kinase